MTSITEKLTVALGDRYRIERELGEAGMATVYLAEDLNHERKVAFKVVNRAQRIAVWWDELFAAQSGPDVRPTIDGYSIQ